MMSSLWTRKAVVVAAAVVTVVCLGAFVSFGLASPEPVSSAALGPDWQCSRLAFVFTTCTRIGTAETAAFRVRTRDNCPHS
jgi:hypothetical protein